MITDFDNMTSKMNLLINKGSIDRGLFLATIYHTKKISKNCI